MNKYSPVVNGRIGLYYPDLGLKIEKEKAYEILLEKGFTFEKKNIAQVIMLCLGKPYKRGSKISWDTIPETFDCSSLVKWIYGQLGIWLPRISIDQFFYGEEIDLINLKPGDLVFTEGAIPYHEGERVIGHVGIFDGENVIHAANKDEGVISETIEQTFSKGIRGLTRVEKNLAELDTVVIPTESKIEYFNHLKWRILQNL